MYELIEEEFEGVVMIVTFKPWRLSPLHVALRHEGEDDNVRFGSHF